MRETDAIGEAERASLGGADARLAARVDARAQASRRPVDDGERNREHAMARRAWVGAVDPLGLVEDELGHDA